MGYVIRTVKKKKEDTLGKPGMIVELGLLRNKLYCPIVGVCCVQR